MSFESFSFQGKIADAVLSLIGNRRFWLIERILREHPEVYAFKSNIRLDIVETRRLHCRWLFIKCHTVRLTIMAIETQPTDQVSRVSIWTILMCPSCKRQIGKIENYIVNLPSI
jgi:hypothetical protein